MTKIKTSIEYSEEEREILKSIKKDEFVPVKGAELKRMADAIAARKKRDAYGK